MQAKVHKDFSMGNLSPQSPPSQIQNMPEAVSYSTATSRFADQVARLLASLCHPDPSLRAVAADVLGTAWLKEAVAKPLPPCPNITVLL